MSVPHGAATFGSLLREHRLAAGLTQEALAECSGVSPRTIQEVEAGGVRPRRTTVASLARALNLADHDREAFERATSPGPRRRYSRPTGGAAPGRGQSNVVAMPQAPAVEAAREHSLVALRRPAQTNVPPPVGGLVGRAADLAAVRKLVTVGRQRLVTLVGVGGAGKTRLSLQLASEVLSEFVDGVWFVELAPASNPMLVPRIVAGTLGVREVSDAPMLDTLLGFLRRKRLLLVLDNCEHLIEACAAIADRLLRVCPDLHIVATSREPLGIVGEHRWTVKPLDVPDESPTTPFATFAATASVQLLVERARTMDARFRLTDANRAAVTQVCARLDGIPLAIELAASRLGVLSVDQVAERLDDSFRILGSRPPDGTDRQQTMDAAIGWSYELLSAPEKSTFRRLSAFAGAFSLEAAEAVCSDADFSPADVVDVLALLVEKSLVVAEKAPSGRRYRLLEPVRCCAERLFPTGRESERARMRHATYFAALATRASPELSGPGQTEWLERLEGERDNLWAAMDTVAKYGSVDAGLRLAVALTPYWEARGYLSEGRRWLEIVLKSSRAAGVVPDAHLETLIAAGRLAHWQIDLEAAAAVLTEALSLARARADRHREAETLGWLSSVHRQRGDTHLGLQVGEASLRLARESGDEAAIAFALLNVGTVLRQLRETDRAVATLDESLRRYRQLGDARYAAIALTMFGWATLQAGDHTGAARILRSCVQELRIVGDQRFIVFAIRGLAHVSRAQGELRRAVQLYAASEAFRTALGMSQPPLNIANDRVFLGSLREHLAASEFDAAYADGTALTLDEALAAAAAAP